MSKNIVPNKRDLIEIFKKYNWKENNFNRKVKSTKTIKHSLIYKNNELTKDVNFYYMDKKSVDNFDVNGNLIESLSFDNRGVRTTLLIPSYDSRSYVTNFEFYDDKGCLMAKCSFEHLKNGNTIEKWDSGGKVILKYNLEKNSIEKYHYFDDGSLNWKEIYTYFNDSNLIEWSLFDGYTRMKTISLTDTFGNVITNNEYDSNGNILKKTKYDYKLDEHKNWIEKKEFLIENNVEIPKTIFEREIKYY